MIYAMQRRVNARTELYGKQYKGEQAPPPDTAPTEKEAKHYEMIQGELKDLSKRQEKIGKVTKRHRHRQERGEVTHRCERDARLRPGVLRAGAAARLVRSGALAS